MKLLPVQQQLPRTRCVHCPVGSLAPACHPCSFLAICYRPPLKFVSNSEFMSCKRAGHFIISLSLTIRLISAMRRELTHTVHHISWLALRCSPPYKRTLLADQGIVAIIRVVCITRRGTATITKGSKVKFLYVSVEQLRYLTKLTTHLGTRDQTARSVLSCGRISGCISAGDITPY